MGGAPIEHGKHITYTQEQRPFKRVGPFCPKRKRKRRTEQAINSWLGVIGTPKNEEDNGGDVLGSFLKSSE